MDGGRICIGVDLMGGDDGADIMIPAVGKFSKLHPNIQVIAYGSVEAVAKIMELKRSNVESIETTHNIIDEKAKGGDVNPMRLLANGGRESSIVQGIQAIKSGKLDGFLSRGNTGALVLTSTRELGTKGESPALSIWAPRKKAGDVLVMDVGAYPDATEEHLLRNAELGVLYLQTQGISQPKIALLNVGTESYKGREMYRKARNKLAEKYGSDFLDNFEPKDVFDRTDADLIVVGGHEGNIWLKTAEATSDLLRGEIKETLFKTFMQKVMRLKAGWLLKKRLSRFHPDNRPDGTVHGIDGKVVKIHGGAGVNPVVVGMERMVDDIIAKKNTEA